MPRRSLNTSDPTECALNALTLKSNRTTLESIMSLAYKGVENEKEGERERVKDGGARGSGGEGEKGR